ncbi:hypothetical protein SEA_FORZA_72 [Gordonia phage Forza]|uniref:Uncharacterized protein n=1 Tax=Gordonia phage Forza TaxID=2571247 RepID=A0A650EZF3_9CAUD|nr:hypothetical protein PP303_gp072 [Gordonia phage Forza]QEM41541.1 hypothetical protein SEA_BOOPY_72 [Gordonia phage Boopy]QGT55065.1 hypothetical protein SEA_FORZA_72 [Gordonia phage Forza]UXE04214.1 hypothetical protein SEA_BLUENGOLD_70 [Gordonia phage BlueNGold]WBF03853.1 hypothetical protein SEA_MAREELIH_70 [Gordonia phage Mareelih]
MVAITFIIIVILTVFLIFTVSAAFMGWNQRDLKTIRKEQLKTEESRQKVAKMLKEKEHLWTLMTPEERAWIRANVDLSEEQ